MMPHAYMAPASVIQQMYPGNPMLTYQTAMNLLSPQQGQHGIYNYRPQDQPQSDQQQQQQQQPPQAQTEQQRSHEGSPATPTMVAAPAATKSDANNDSDDEGSKLTILSQLCSAVLDRSDAPATATVPAKVEPSEQTHSPSPQVDAKPAGNASPAPPATAASNTTGNATQATPPPSSAHSREASQEGVAAKQE